MNKPEILAPAGSMEAMEAAVKAGADAVYMGGTMFGARAYANNPGQEELVEAIRYVHLYDRKLYLTLNTLVKEEEMSLVGDYLFPYYEAGLDGIIIQDPGVFSFIQRNFPGLPLHASTQMNITGLAAAKLLKEAGASRIVPARELSLDEIRTIKEETGLEIETFVHGALCYCYSGRCLMSSMIGGRSGNRGRCAQPCRLPYEIEGKKKPSYLLSPKDLCTITMMPELIEAGIDSFKIEGRMKNPEYVAVIVSVYRKYLDYVWNHPGKPYQVEEDDWNLLLEAYNRGGFTTGYYDRHNGPDMMSMDRPNHQGIFAGKIEKIKDGEIYFHPEIRVHKGDVFEVLTRTGDEVVLTSNSDCLPGKNFKIKGRKIKSLHPGMSIFRTANPWQKQQLKENLFDPICKKKVGGKAIFAAGEPASLTLWTLEGKETVIEVTGDPVVKASEHPVTEEQVKKPLMQTGNSPFVFADLQIEVGQDAFYPMGGIKKLRREAFLQMQKKLEERDMRNLEKPEVWVGSDSLFCSSKEEKDEPELPKLRVSVEDKTKLEFLLNHPKVDGIYFPLEELSSEERRRWRTLGFEQKKQIFYAFPRVFRNKEQIYYDEIFDELLQEKPDGFLIRNMDELGWIRSKRDRWKDRQIEIVLDHSLYSYNREALFTYRKWLGEDYTVVWPLELNKKELFRLNDDETKGDSGHFASSSEWIVYGRIPLMVSVQCPTKNTTQCVQEPGYMKITDRLHKHFYGRRHCRHCYNTIWNGTPLSMQGLSKDWKERKPSSVRIHFTMESEEEMRRKIDLFYEEWKEGKPVSQMGGEYTRGHYNRGVE